MSVTGMPGQAPGSKQGSVTDTTKRVAVAIIKRKVEDMMQLPDGKNVLASRTVQGGLVWAIGILFGVASSVLKGDASLTDAATIQQILAALGIIWGSIGARKAIAESGPNGGR